MNPDFVLAAYTEDSHKNIKNIYLENITEYNCTSIFNIYSVPVSFTNTAS